jgi:hypothetical protein
MTDQLTPAAMMTTKASRRWRQGSRKPELPAGLECAQAEDEIVRLLCGPGMSVSSQQAATAVELARRCAAIWAGIGRCARDAGARSSVYQLHGDHFAWLSEAWAVYTEKPDDEVMRRLDEVVDAIPFDAAAVASLNAARWIVRRYERHRH